MGNSPRYYMLMASLPALPPLFTSDQTPISRIRLDQRLEMLEPEDRAELAEIEDLTRWDRLPLDITDPEIIERANDVIPRIRSETLRDVASWRLEVRTVVAAIRRRAMGKQPPAPAERWGYGRWVRHIEQKWTASDFGLGVAMPWVGEFSRLTQEGDTLGFEQQLLDLSWRYMSRAADGHYFTFEAVALYVLRWDVIARWTAYNGDVALERFGRLVSEGMGEHAGLFGTAKSGVDQAMTTKVYECEMSEEFVRRETAKVVAVQQGLVTIELDDAADGAGTLTKNEVVLIRPSGSDERLKAEILRVKGRTAEAQVYEETRGVAVGDGVEQTGRMLSVKLGPGLLGQVYDGLQNPLELIAAEHGFFLPRGVEMPPLNMESKWPFTPVAEVGMRLRAGDVIGTVQEGNFTHKIMVPFEEPSVLELTWIQGGAFTVDTPVARVRDETGKDRALTMMQEWPVRRAVPDYLLRHKYSERLYPSEPMVTTQRLIDTFFPIARGGTACIPGPFGSGKTVLQHLVSRHSSVDIVIVVACGERAGEVVETITEFPELTDPKTGGPLMDRTIIICNTSSMPVAAREASIYTGIALGEYYRQMGYDALLLADSTSRWAQAMRETSGRMEEIPGEEAFPAYLDSAIRGVYERAGVIQGNDGDVGSLTMIGTVSPAGGNFEEPVTQSTLSTVKCFLGLSADRAYKRFYPAVDPLLSWSRYLNQISEWFDRELTFGWVDKVKELTELLKRGDGIQQMMQVTGEEGVTVEDFMTYQKAVLVDMVYLQQDAFDEVDASASLERQQRSFDLLYDLVTRTYKFDDKDQVRDYFTRLTGTFKNLNYTREDSPEYEKLRGQIVEMADAVTALVATGKS